MPAQQIGEGKLMRQLVLGIAAAGIVAGTALPAAAQGICESLWVERNSIYKDAGYCFKTRRAISYFGNAGCRYEYEGDIPLSYGQRARIQQILAEERVNGCR
jgi:hypothetical protein